MTRRYFVPELPESGGLVQMPDSEARHASRVMRVQADDPVTLFDGRGREAEATIASIDKRNCWVQSQTPVAIDREPTGQMHFGIAFPKPDRAKEMVERLTEIGVRRITPLICDRTQRPPTVALIEKLRRVVVEACKQCGRNTLMEIDSPVPLHPFLTQPRSELRWLADPDGAAPEWSRQQPTGVFDAAVLIGPEGGLTEQEVSRAMESGYRRVGLGKRIYRIETAAVVIASHLSLLPGIRQS